jgi:hypothetical protein
VTEERIRPTYWHSGTTGWCVVLLPKLHGMFQQDKPELLFHDVGARVAWTDARCKNEITTCQNGYRTGWRHRRAKEQTFVVIGTPATGLCCTYGGNLGSKIPQTSVRDRTVPWTRATTIELSLGRAPQRKTRDRQNKSCMHRHSAHHHHRVV